MSEQENTRIIQGAYAAFGRGDIPGVLATLSDDVDWLPAHGMWPDVAWAGPRHGRDQVAAFFKDLADNVTFETFEPRQFIAQGDMVIVLGAYTGVARQTGRRYTSEWVMAFTCRNGKAVKFREYADTAAIKTAVLAQAAV